MSALKDLYNPDFYSSLADILTHVLPGFNRRRFEKMIYTEGFTAMELKQRMRHTTSVVHEFMPGNYSGAVPYIYDIINQYRKNGAAEDRLAFIFLPDYISEYGLEDFELSMEAIEMVTQFITCEYAVRPFLLRYFDRTMEQMYIWSSHTSEKVRRLATEGCRPRLPWAIGVPALKADPAPILPILENLRNDSSEYVRRSVANNLNDISKDYPELLLETAGRWRGQSDNTDAILKHAFRGLLKRGHTEALKYYDLDPADLHVSNFRIHSAEVGVGGDISFSFDLYNASAKAKTARLEYGIYYQKANGSLSKKVFKISERNLQKGERLSLSRRHSFRPVTTRVLYPGEHRLSLIVNGRECIDDQVTFELLLP